MDYSADPKKGESFSFYAFCPNPLSQMDQFDSTPTELTAPVGHKSISNSRIISCHLTRTSFNQSPNQLGLGLTDPYIAGKLRGESIDMLNKQNINFFRPQISQMFFEPEVLVTLTTDSIGLYFKQRPVDLLYLLLLCQIHYPPQDSNKTNRFGVPMMSFRQDSKSQSDVVSYVYKGWQLIL